MHINFVAAFPGLFLNSIDCKSIIEEFSRLKSHRYIIQIEDKECKTGLKFTLSYSQPYKENIDKLFRKKGPNVYDRAKKLSFFFDQTFECELCYIALLKININIPKESEYLERMVKTEAHFQLYHFSKDVFKILQSVEKMVKTEFKLYFTYVGEEGVDGLRKKIAPALKKDMKADFSNCSQRVETEKKKFGSTRVFPISILCKEKRESFKTLMEHRSIVEKNSRNSLERKWLFLLERLSFTEDNMGLTIRNLKEGFAIYQRIIDGYDKIEEIYAFQLEVSGLFMHIIALTLAITALFFEIGIQLLSGIFLLAFIGLYSLETYSLFRYNCGPMISRELDYLSRELNPTDM